MKEFLNNGKALITNLKPIQSMRIIPLLCIIMLLLVSCSKNKPTSDQPEKSKTTIGQDVKPNEDETTMAVTNNQFALGDYKGKLGDRLEVSFHLVNDNGKLSGFYFYEKVGIDIKLVGTVKKNSITAFELDFKKDTVAVINAVINKSGIAGNWVNAKTKKQYPLLITKSDIEIAPLPSTVVGSYYNEVCDIRLSFHKSKGEYYYIYRSNERVLKGKITFSRSDALYINLTNIEYAEDYFDVALFEEDEEKEKKYKNLKEIGKRKLGVECYFNPEELTIQNYGNAMNYYVKLYDCGEKYIHFKRE